MLGEGLREATPPRTVYLQFPAIHGTDTTLQVDNSPVKHFLLKFDVTGIGSQTITNAKIRLYNTDAASEGGDFYHVSDDTWQEDLP